MYTIWDRGILRFFEIWEKLFNTSVAFISVLTCSLFSSLFYLNQFIYQKIKVLLPSKTVYYLGFSFHYYLHNNNWLYSVLKEIRSNFFVVHKAFYFLDSYFLKICYTALTFFIISLQTSLSLQLEGVETLKYCCACRFPFGKV